MSDKNKYKIPVINEYNFSAQNIEKLEAIYKELGITGCSFLRNLKSEETIQKGVEHALSMLTSYKEYSDNAKKGNTDNTERLKLVTKTKVFMELECSSNESYLDSKQIRTASQSGS